MAASSGSATNPRLNRNQTLGLITLLLITSAFFFFIDREGAPPFSRNMVPSAGFTQERILSGVLLQYAPVVKGKTAVIVGTFEPEADLRVIALDINSGDELWQIDSISKTTPQGWPEESRWVWPFAWQWGPLLIHGDRVIVSDAFALTTSLTAYELATGEQVWERSLGWMNGSDVSYLARAQTDIAARVVADNFSEFYQINPENGWQLYRQPGEAAHLFWREAEPLRTYEAKPDQIVVSGFQPWQSEYQSCGADAQLTEAVIILQLARCDVAGTFHLLVLDRLDGSVRWRLDTPLVGNVVLDNGRILILTATAHLLILEIETGVHLAELQFAPDLSQPSETVHYALGAADDQIAVYFGDNQELHFYRFNQE
jgi:outer membrane protein assembly factor BamB